VVVVGSICTCVMTVPVVTVTVVDARMGVSVVVLTSVVVVVTEEVGADVVTVLVRFAVRVMVEVLITFAMPTQATAVGYTGGEHVGFPPLFKKMRCSWPRSSSAASFDDTLGRLADLRFLLGKVDWMGWKFAGGTTVVAAVSVTVSVAVSVMRVMSVDVVRTVSVVVTVSENVSVS